MIPGMNPKMMKQAMKKMGIQQVEIDAQQVIIKCEDKDIVINNPSVSKINMGGQETFQIAGQSEEHSKETKPEINDEDVKTVVEQTGVSEEQAKKAIEDNEGDLAAAIMSLKQ